MARALDLCRDHLGTLPEPPVSTDSGVPGAADAGTSPGTPNGAGRDGAAGEWRNSFLRAPYTRDALVRLGTAIGKYWICKRAPGHAYEALECIGGSGVMEDSPMPRLYREAPVNAIWEGSGNVQCLDVLRAIQKTPDTLEAYFHEVGEARGEHRALDAHVATLKNDLRDGNDFEAHARDLCDRLALGLQASVIARSSPPFVADAFCRSRLECRGAHNYGAFPRGVDAAAIVERAAAR